MTDDYKEVVKDIITMIHLYENTDYGYYARILSENGFEENFAKYGPIRREVQQLVAIMNCRGLTQFNIDLIIEASCELREQEKITQDLENDEENEFYRIY